MADLIIVAAIFAVAMSAAWYLACKWSAPYTSPVPSPRREERDAGDDMRLYVSHAVVREGKR